MNMYFLGKRKVVVCVGMLKDKVLVDSASDTVPDSPKHPIARLAPDRCSNYRSCCSFVVFYWASKVNVTDPPAGLILHRYSNCSSNPFFCVFFVDEMCFLNWMNENFGWVKKWSEMKFKSKNYENLQLKNRSHLIFFHQITGLDEEEGTFIA